MQLDRTAGRPCRLSLTPLIDIIFLLLLFFMLSSTFSKFAEIELTGAESGAQTTTTPAFVQLRGNDISVNGLPVMFDELQAALESHSERGAEVAFISINETVTSQRFVDIYAMVRGIEALDLALVN